jgi:type I restriction enzyme S subunit
MSNNWPTVKLGEILTPATRAETPMPGTAYRQIGVKLWGEGAYERETMDGAQTKYAQLFRTEAGDIIVNKIWARNGSVAVVPSSLAGCYGSGEFPMFAPRPDRLSSEWMHWLTKTRNFWAQCDEKSRGTSGKNRIRPDQFLRVEIPLPQLSEQQRIVAKIEELSAKIKEARVLRKQASEEAEAVVAREIADLFSRGKEKGWSERPLGDYVIDDCYGTSEKTTDDVSGTAVLRMGNIQNGRLEPRDLKYLHLSDKDRSKLLLNKGDILVNRTNSAELVGKCAVFSLDGEFAFASYIIRLRFDTSRAEPRLVAAYINSPAGRAYMFSERKQMTGQANVNATTLKALPIALPDLEQQKHIMSYLDHLNAQVDVLRQEQSATAVALDALMPSILDKAFRGEL